MKYVFIIALLIFSSCSTSKYFSFESTKLHSERKNHKKILAVGMCKAPARNFLAGLNESLGAKLRSREIDMEYHFLGSDGETASQSFNSIEDKERFDGVMVFCSVNRFFFCRRNE